MSATQRWAVGFLLSAITTIASAATVYRATRTDYGPERRDYDVRVVVDEQSTRVDIVSGHQQLMTMIESGNRLALIDFANGVYALQDEHRSVDANAPVMQPTSRRQFALGSYCQVFEVHWSDRIYDERCAAPREIAVHFSAHVGDFLALVAATGDLHQLFAQASWVAAHGETGGSFPYIVRHFEEGRVTSELRMVSVTQDGASSGGFDIPRGLRRVSFQTEAKQAAR